LDRQIRNLSTERIGALLAVVGPEEVSQAVEGLMVLVGD